MYVEKGIKYLRGKLASKFNYVHTRYKYYDQKYTVYDFGISTPDNMKGTTKFDTILGWATTSVDALEKRLKFRRVENDTFGINELLADNNKDIFIKAANKSALISSCAFIYVFLNDDKEIDIQVIDGGNATGIIDQKTYLLKEGYAVLDRDDLGVPTLEAHFNFDRTDYYENGEFSYSIKTNCNRCQLVPWIYNPNDRYKFGNARITKSQMDIIQGACRTLKRAEITAEYYSYPQKYALGIEDDYEAYEKFRASISKMLIFTRDEETGQTPTVGQFQQSSMAPFNEQFQNYVKAFCGETGLNSDDLGYITSNPMSAEAIEYSHETLRLATDKAIEDFSIALLNVGLVAKSVQDGYHYLRKEFANCKVIWAPTFKPSASTIGAIGDASIKLNQVNPDFITSKTLESITGIERYEDIEGVDE